MPAAAADGDACRYWAFLSYSHTDSKQADRLHDWLERFRTPPGLVGNPHPLGTIPERLTPIFRDRHELAAASSLGREIDEALTTSRYLIVLCSPAAARSRWVDQEIRAFKRIHGEERVLAAIVGGEPFSGAEDECFPEALRHRVGKDGRPTRQKVEPIAADLRDDRDGWRTGALKLVAGLLDVGLDDLIQREQLRRQRRMTWIVAASVAGMAFTTGLSVVAINARDAARDERRQAEGLVGFMLGDLKGELEPIGRLDALDKVGAKALAYYERQDKKELTDDQLAQRSKALTLLGQIATTRDNLDGALARYREAMRGTEELVARAPTDPKRLFDHAQNVFYVGDIARQRGQLGESEKAFTTYRDLADRMVAAAPADPQYRLEKKYAETALGVLLYDTRRYRESTQRFASALATVDGLIARDRSNLDYLKSRAETLSWLASSRENEGELRQALAILRQQADQIAAVARRAPRDVWVDDRTMTNLRMTGRITASLGDVRKGADQAAQAIAIARRLQSTEPGNMVWRKSAAAVEVERAAMLLLIGSIGAAAQALSDGCSTLPTGQSDDDIVEWRGVARKCKMMEARLALARGDSGSALVKSGEALASARRYRSGDDVSDRLAIGEAQMVIGDILRSAGLDVAARDAYRSGLDQWPVSAPMTPRLMAVKQALLRGAGKVEEARQLDVALQRSGYRRLI